MALDRTAPVLVSGSSVPPPPPDDSRPAAGHGGRLRPIPPHVLSPVVGLLQPYHPSLTERLLVEALARIDVVPQGPDLLAPLTKAEVARLGQVSLRTVTRWIERGDLPARKIGRLVRVPRRAVEALLSAPAASEGRADA